MTALPSRVDLARDAYEEHLYALWTAADTAVHGYMVNDLAAARGIRGADLYLPGAGRAPESAASGELKAAWDLGLAPRPVSFAAFKRANRPAEPERERDQPREEDTVRAKCPECGKYSDLTLLDRAAVARMLKIKPGSVSAYVSRGWFPEPDARFGGVGVWLERSVTDFLYARDRRNRDGRRGPAPRVTS